MTSAKDWVPAGGSLQARGGEIFLPVQAYFAGMDCPFTNASLVNARDIVASVEVVSDGIAGSDGIAVAAGAQAATRRVRNRKNER
jgi:hypothetical protein